MSGYIKYYITRLWLDGKTSLIVLANLFYFLDHTEAPWGVFGAWGGQLFSACVWFQSVLLYRYSVSTWESTYRRCRSRRSPWSDTSPSVIPCARRPCVRSAVLNASLSCCGPLASSTARHGLVLSLPSKRTSQHPARHEFDQNLFTQLTDKRILILIIQMPYWPISPYKVAPKLHISICLMLNWYSFVKSQPNFIIFWKTYIWIDFQQNNACTVHNIYCAFLSYLVEIILFVFCAVSRWNLLMNYVSKQLNSAANHTKLYWSVYRQCSVRPPLSHGVITADERYIDTSQSYTFQAGLNYSLHYASLYRHWTKGSTVKSWSLRVNSKCCFLLRLKDLNAVDECSQWRVDLSPFSPVLSVLCFYLSISVNHHHYSLSFSALETSCSPYESIQCSRLDSGHSAFKTIPLKIWQEALEEVYWRA